MDHIAGSDVFTWMALSMQSVKGDDREKLSSKNPGLKALRE